jgi:hypothetical protein
MSIARREVGGGAQPHDGRRGEAILPAADTELSLDPSSPAAHRSVGAASARMELAGCDGERAFDA